MRLGFHLSIAGSLRRAVEWYNLLVARSLVPGTLLLAAGEPGPEKHNFLF